MPADNRFLSSVPYEERTFQLCMERLRTYPTNLHANSATLNAINHVVPRLLKKRVETQCKLEGLI